jgi:uncharacterized protein (DUF1800 family)
MSSASPRRVDVRASIVPEVFQFMRHAHMNERKRFASATATAATLVASAALHAATTFAGVSEPAVAPKVSLANATRFLEQSSFGPTPASVAQVQSVGIQTYLAQQFATPATGYAGYVYFPPNPQAGCPTGSPPYCRRDNYTILPIQMQFFRNAVNGPDQLRQRVAFALSQIFVVSGLDEKQPYAMAAYQNLLLNDAFVNFSQLLTDVTLSPVMGDYLSMADNDWTPGSGENDPNENYAREVMQLFSIGLVKLNIDGTPVLKNGQVVPTYGQAQVDGFADVFTGWTYEPRPGANPKWPDATYFLGSMLGFPAHHDADGGEPLLNGYSLPVNDDQGTDLTESINNIFTHQNVGPFIGKQLIQQLVTSNPSPAYVKAVAQKFNNDGTGVRGNMQAVITEILTNAEARSATQAAGPTFGKLREPALMIAAFLRGIGGATQTDGYFPSAQSAIMQEQIFDSPTVFNYYQPTYPLPESNLVGPPFGIFDATTSFARYDFADQLINAPIPPDTTIDFIKPTGTSLDLTYWIAAAADATTLISDINSQFFHGAMSTALTGALNTLLSQVPATDPTGRAKSALYLALTSPEYQVEK